MRRHMRSLSDPAGNLEVEKSGVGAAGFDQLVTAKLEIIGWWDVYSAETRAQALEVEIEKKYLAVEYLDPLIEGITKEKAPVLWVDSCLRQRQNAAVEATQRLHAARPTSSSSKKLSRARKKLSTSGSWLICWRSLRPCGRPWVYQPVNLRSLCRAILSGSRWATI